MEPDEKELDIIAGLPEGTLKTLQDCIMRVCELDIFSSSVVNRLLYEVGDGNLDVVMGLRTCTDEVEEEEALVNPRDKEVSKEFSAPKREIVTLERIL